MKIKPGDIVRFLNSVGGGKVTRVVDNLAYVDDDGFETPVLVSECVVVGESAAPKAAASYTTAAPIKETAIPEPTRLPVVETAGGDTLNLVLGIEPINIKTLSTTTFEASFVNDSNYYIFLTVATRTDEEQTWTLRFDGIVEPNIQEFLFDIGREELPLFDHISVQYVAFKRDRRFEVKKPGGCDIKFDTTKFVKLHCFSPNPYFERPAITFDIARDDRPVKPVELPPLHEPQKESRRISVSRSSKPSKEIIEVDLHAAELLDNTAGLSPAEILNYQIDRFCEVMDNNRRNYGQKIVFIHGKGEGVLRQAIMKELTHRYKGHDVQDASFREYGFGATQVTIRNIGTDQKPGNRKERRR